MNQVLTGNGNGNGANDLIRQLKITAAKASAAGSLNAVRESRVTFQTADGVELREYDAPIPAADQALGV